MQHEPAARERILAAARHLFATQGFHQTPMSELAPAAQVSVGQIYRIFANKDDIIRALVQDDATVHLHGTAAIVDGLRRGDTTPLDAAIALTRQAMSESDEALSFEILAEAHRSRAIADLIGDMCLQFRRHFRDLACIANPALNDNQLDGFEELLLALMFGLGHRQLSRSALSVEETARRTGRAILAAIHADA